VLVSSMPEHAKRYRNNYNEISQHHAVDRSGDTEDPTQEVVIYEETYPYPAEYDQPQDYYPQHYNHQYQQRPGTNPNDRTDNRRVFFGGAALSVLDPHALQAPVTSSSARKRRHKREISPRIFTDVNSVNPAVGIISH